MGRSARPAGVILSAVIALIPALPAWGGFVPPVATGINHLNTNLPGNFHLGTNVNELIGATRFYNAGFTGQGVIAANVEAGHIWNGHESLQHVTHFTHHQDAWGITTSDLFDRHATWVAMHIGGRATATNSGNWQVGISPGVDLRSGAIASTWSGNAFSLGFNFTTNAFLGGYVPHFGTAGVINSSWGGTSPAGTNFFAVALDGLAAQNTETALVASAGNSGPGANSIGFPGSGYNAITVAALQNGGDNSYNTIANFSSRGPQDYADPVNGIIPGVRAAIDIAAPGTNLTAAYYGGQTGGNNPTLPGSADSGAPNFYSFAVSGTSFAAPIVSGGVALLKSASVNTPALASNPASRDTLVVKSVLMNSAGKTVGWSNGQVPNANGGVDTTQALDYLAGAGAVDLDRAFDQYLTAGTRDVSGLGAGNLGLVEAVGWDLGNVAFESSNLYTIDSLLEAGSTFNVTLNWFRNRTFTVSTLTPSDLGQADLTLEVLDVISNLVISRSASLYNLSEHLSFELPATSRYGIRVVYGSNTFGGLDNVNYGLAWSGVVYIPEPASLGMVALGCVVLGRRRR